MQRLAGEGQVGLAEGLVLGGVGVHERSDVGVPPIAQRLPPAGPMLNLCEDRYRFLVAYAAALSVGHAVLLPPSLAASLAAQ